jgi:hypothetical protein
VNTREPLPLIILGESCSSLGLTTALTAAVSLSSARNGKIGGILCARFCCSNVPDAITACSVTIARSSCPHFANISHEKSRPQHHPRWKAAVLDVVQISNRLIVHPLQTAWTRDCRTSIALGIACVGTGASPVRAERSSAAVGSYTPPIRQVPRQQSLTSNIRIVTVH